MAGTDLGRPWPEGNYEAAFLEWAQSKCFRLEDDVGALSSASIYFEHPSVAAQFVIVQADDDSRLRQDLDQR